MTDEIIPLKRGRGRPRKNPETTTTSAPVANAAPSLTKHRMKAKPNWEDIDMSFTDDSPDRLRIDPSLVPTGMSLQWVTDSVYGQGVPQHRAEFEKRGWTPVHQEDFDRILDGMFMPRGAAGEIMVDGMVLMARPEELTRKAKMADRRKAQEVIRIKEQALRGGDLNTSLDSQHPSALQTNRITRSMERIEIPKD